MADGGLEIGKESLIQPNTLRYSDEEYPFDQLSGDEALSKSFMQSVANSDKKPAKTGLFLTAIQIVKSMVGIGILGIPSVAKQYGVFFTITLITLVGIMGYWSSVLFLKCKNICGKSNMSTIGYYIFRSKWIIIMVNIMIIMVNLGVCMSELLIFGDTVQNIIAVDKCPISQQEACRDAFPFYYQKWFLKCSISVVLLPFLIVKNIERLRFVSLTAIISISTFTVLVIYNIFVKEGYGPGFSFWLPVEFSIEKAIAKAPTIFLAYSWQFNVFPIFKGMYRPTDERNKYSMIIGYFLTTGLYLTVGILGYATYGNVIDTLYLNYINPQDISKTLYIILNLTFVISTTLTIPIIFFGGRNNTIQLIKQIKDPFRADDLYTEPKVKTQLVSDAQDQPSTIAQIKLNREKTNLYFYIISIIIFAILLVGSIFISDLGIIYNILGAISANAVQLTFPTLYYFMLVIKRGKKFRTRGAQFQFYFTIFMFGLSLVISFVCVAANFV